MSYIDLRNVGRLSIETIERIGYWKYLTDTHTTTFDWIEQAFRMNSLIRVTAGPTRTRGPAAG